MIHLLPLLQWLAKPGRRAEIVYRVDLRALEVRLSMNHGEVQNTVMLTDYDLQGRIAPLVQLEEALVEMEKAKVCPAL